MDYTNVTDGDTCKIKMQGKFTFSDHIEFKKVFTVFSEDSLKNVEVDVSAVEFVDSAALGLLLLLRDEAEKNNVKLLIVKPQGQLQKMFKISRFYELFSIVD